MMEPTVRLTTGACVLQAVYDTLATCQERGHVVSIDDAGSVHVTPPVHEYTLHILDSNWHDVAEILAEQQGVGLTVH